MAGKDLWRKYDFKTEPIPRLQFDSIEADNRIRQGLPVILEGSNLAGPALRWTNDYLADHIGDGLFSVYTSNNHLFMYFDEKKIMHHHLFKPPMKRCEMKFKEFLQKMKHSSHGDPRFYLQQSLNDKVGKSIVQDFVQFNWNFINTQAKKNNWGPLTSNLLLIGQEELGTTKLIYGGDSSVRGDGGGRGCEVRAEATYTIPEHKTCKNCWHSKGNITPCHYDEQENFFSQLIGQKRVILFPPENFDCMYPYPVHHPHDRQSQVDFENPNYDLYPKFRDVTPLESILNPGDVLYLPMYWFHHFESWRYGGPTTSLTFWYKAAPTADVVWPLKPHQKMAMMRNIEKMIGDALNDHREVAPFLQSLVLGRYTHDPDQPPPASSRHRNTENGES